MMEDVVSRIRVLVVDDDANVLTTLKWQLETFADVTARSSVESALPLIEAGRFDAVVADLRLPNRWGDELLARVAARSPTTRRFLITGDADPRRTVRELLESGVIDAYFTKPSFDGLFDALGALIPPEANAPPVP